MLREVVVQGVSNGAPLVASIGSSNDFKMEIATDQRWSVDDASARTLRDGYDALVLALGVQKWVDDEKARWAQSP